MKIVELTRDDERERERELQCKRTKIHVEKKKKSQGHYYEEQEENTFTYQVMSSLLFSLVLSDGFERVVVLRFDLFFIFFQQ